MRLQFFTYNFLSIIGFLIFAIGCSNSQAPSPENAEAGPSKHVYPQMPLPDFLDSLFINHFSTIKSAENQGFTKFCEANGLSTADSLNQSNYFRIQFLHDLFTSTGAYDCNRGGILKLPYFWHWTTPNPRYEIEYLTGESPKKLSEIKPPYGFQRYNSLADVDRTPDLYLSDMVTEKPKYRHPDCGNFYTFGWCSEREMAFSALFNMIGLESKVVVKGNHSWSEIMLEFETEHHSKKQIIAKVDNTFDTVEFNEFTAKIETWREELGITKTNKWYNEKSREKVALNKIHSLMVIPNVSQRIESAVLAFYQ